MRCAKRRGIVRRSGAVARVLAAACPALVSLGIGCGSSGSKGSEAPAPAATPPAAADAQSADGQLELARVGEKAITLADLRDFYQDMAAELQSGKSGVDKQRDHLQTLIDMELLRLEALARQVDQTPAFLDKMSRYTRDRLVGIYLMGKVRVLVTPQEVRDYFEQQGLSRAVRFGHLIAANRDSAQAALAAIEGGLSFQEAAQTWSIDSVMARRGGDTGRYAIELDLPERLREALFALQRGQVSEPIDLDGAFGVFANLDEIEAPLDPERFQSIYQQLFLQRSAKERAALVDSLRQVFRLELDRQGLRTFVAAMRAGEPADAVVLYRYAGGQITGADLLAGNDPLERVAMRREGEAATQKRAEGSVVSDALLVAAARREGLDQREDVKRYLAEKRAEELVVQLRVQVLDQGVSITDEEVRREYEQNPTRYARREEWDIQEILVDTEEQAAQLLGRIRQGESMGALAREHSRRPLDRRDKEGRMTLSLADGLLYGMLVSAARKATVGEPTGPVRVKEGYSIFRVLERRRPPATFAESSTRARATVNWIKKQQVFDQFLRDLRAKHADRVTIREDNLERAASG